MAHIQGIFTLILLSQRYKSTRLNGKVWSLGKDWLQQGNVSRLDLPPEDKGIRATILEVMVMQNCAAGVTLDVVTGPNL